MNNPFVEVYTFQVRWPAPFAGEWQTSGRRWATIPEATKAMAAFAEAAFINDAILEFRLHSITGGIVNT